MSVCIVHLLLCQPLFILFKAVLQSWLFCGEPKGENIDKLNHQ